LDGEKIQEKSRAIGLAGALAHASQPQTYKELMPRGEFLFAQGERRQQMGHRLRKGHFLHKLGAMSIYYTQRAFVLKTRLKRD